MHNAGLHATAGGVHATAGRATRYRQKNHSKHKPLNHAENDRSKSLMNIFIDILTGEVLRYDSNLSPLLQRSGVY